MPASDLVDVALAGLAGLCDLMALTGCLITLAMLIAVRRFARQRRAPALATAYPSVTILKPLHGDEPQLAENLASFCRQDYPAPVELVFGVQRGEDGALPAARQVIADHPDIAIHLVIDDTRHGENGKVSNLVNMQRAIGHAVIVLADSDMRVDADYLRRVVEALHVPDIGLVSLLYRGKSIPNFWSRMSTAGIDFHFLPSVIFGLSLGLAEPCFGSTIALRRDTFDKIGGFMPFKDVLADDYAIGQAVRGLGLGAAVLNAPVLEHLCTDTSMRSFIRQELRWSRTIRSLDPVGFAGAIVTNPLPLAVFAWLFGGFGQDAGGIVLLTLACRAALQVNLKPFAGATNRLGWLGLRDFASFAIFVASFWPGSLDWRGQTFAVDADGTLSSQR